VESHKEKKLHEERNYIRNICENNYNKKTLNLENCRRKYGTVMRHSKFGTVKYKVTQIA
jgi:hypothetical protein